MFENHPLLGYSLRRTTQAVPLLIWILVLNFLLVHAAPGDPAVYLASLTEASPEAYARLRAEFGLDKPLYEQLAIYLGKVLQGDLGYSSWYQTKVLDVILARIPATFLLMFTAFVLASALGVALGVLAARWSYSAFDQAATFVSLLGYSMPVFWLGQLVLIGFALHLDWFPSQGMVTLGADLVGWDRVLDVARHLALPAFTFATYHLTLVFRLTRIKMQEVLSQDYVLTAKAKGVSERGILLHHALPNAILPVVTVLGVHFGFMMAGSVLVETVFAWPGMGRLMFESIHARDYPMILGIFIVVSSMVVFANLLTDIIYAWIDPRVGCR